MFGMQQGWLADAWGWHFMWGTGGFLMIIGMILFWALIIGGTIYLIQRFAQREAPQPIATPLETLKLRYARGQIDKQEYEAKKTDLLGT